MVIQWFPGHMNKAKKLLQGNIKNVDVVIEVLDARVPISSRNPALKEIIGNTTKIIILNKADLADKHTTRRWLEYFTKEGNAIAVNSKDKKGILDVIKILRKTSSKSKSSRKLNLEVPIRAMVVGIPNVGKSMFINALAGKASTKIENRPGVTRGKQWINIDEKIQLLDTPGILWPKFNDSKTGLHLAYVNAIGPKAYDKIDISIELIDYLQKKYPNNLQEAYKINELSKKPEEILEDIARNRGYIIKGGEYDILKSAENVLKRFQDGQLGKISIEKPEDFSDV